MLRRIVNRPIARGKAGAGDGRTRLTMVHAWVWLPNPDGVFADRHRALPYLRAGLPADWADAVDGDDAGDAAEGLALLTDGACANDVERLDPLLRLDRGQERALRVACASSAAEVWAALDASGDDPRALNGAAAEAWRRYDATKTATLRPEQAARLAAMVEHPMGEHGGH